MRYLILLVLVVSIAFGCSTEVVKTQLNAKDHYLRGKRFLDKGDYLNAIEEFRTVTYNFPGSDLVDDAQYGLAEAYFHSEDYTNAIFEYERILKDFPLSPLVDEAQFKVALCYFRQSLSAQLDQENTYKALDGFHRFVEEYPNSELVEEAEQKILECRTKLAKKAYLNARLYAKMGDYQAALIYYREVVQEFNDTKWLAPAEFGISEVLLKQGKKEEALKSFQKVIDGKGDRGLKKEAAKKIEQIIKGK